MGDLQVLSENLFKWMMIAGAFGMIVPASTDTLPMFTPSAYEADLVPQTQANVTIAASVGPSLRLGSSTSPSGAELSLEAQIATYREAYNEATAALRLLRGLGQQISVQEVGDYVATLRAALSSTPGKPTLEQTRSLAQWLRNARTQLLDNAGSLRAWLTIAELLDPTGGPHPVPKRFVKWESPSSDPTLVEVASKFRVRRALATFLGDDADSRSGRT
jgi:hypothetical protein